MSGASENKNFPECSQTFKRKRVRKMFEFSLAVQIDSLAHSGKILHEHSSSLSLTTRICRYGHSENIRQLGIAIPCSSIGAIFCDRSK